MSRPRYVVSVELSETSSQIDFLLNDLVTIYEGDDLDLAQRAFRAAVHDGKVEQ